MKDALQGLTPLFAVLTFAAINAGCGAETLGDCVTRYFDGDILRQSSYTQQECNDNCAARMGPGGTGVNVIASCVWEGRRESVLPTGI